MCVCVGKPSLNVVWGSRAAVSQPARGRLSTAAVHCPVFMYCPPLAIQHYALLWQYRTVPLPGPVLVYLTLPLLQSFALPLT